MPRSSDRNGAQVEPFAAIVAVFAVCLGLSLYAGVVDDRLRERSNRAVTETALASVEDAIAPAAVARPTRIGPSQDVGPEGLATNVTLTAGDRRWSAGPKPPKSAGRATSKIGVRVKSVGVVAGELEVSVW